MGITNVYTKRLDYLNKSGFTQKIHLLYNESVQVIKKYVNDNGINFQFKPPHVNRSNDEER